MTDGGLPRRQRIGAYAVIVRDGMVLLCRLAPWLSESPLWTLPGGGVEFGEDPRDAVVREVHEETGLDAMIGDSAHVHSVRFHASNSGTDMHSVRIVYDGWVPRDAPEPHVVERDGSTVDAAWFPLADVASGAVTVSGLVSDALAAHAPAARQRLAAYALVRRGDEVLLTRISATGAHRAPGPCPAAASTTASRPPLPWCARCGRRPGSTATVGDLLGVHDEHFTGTAPTGRTEDFHGVHLVFAADVGTEDAGVVETGGTTDRVAWVALGDVTGGRVAVTDVVGFALGLSGDA